MIETKLAGAKLSAAIKESGMSCAELARRCGVSRQWLYGLRKAEFSNVSRAMLDKLKLHLKCSEGKLTAVVRR